MALQPTDPRSRPSRGTGTLLVTGATGFVGSHLCRLLARNRTPFRALIRASSDRRLLDGTGGWLIEGDITRPSSCLLYTSPSPRDVEESRMPSSA